MMKIKDIIQHLEQIAPPSYQESYDNSGLLTGSPSDEVSGILVTLDVTEAVVDESVAKGCNLIIAHHPIIFTGLKKLTGANYVERTVIKAIQNNIAIYAIHTNLDNVRWGVNNKIADKLGLINRKVLAPKEGLLMKLETYVPNAQKKAVLEALFEAGAGKIGQYDECSFQIKGVGTFRGSSASNPFIGKPGILEEANEIKIEVIFPAFRKPMIISALRDSHPYEEIAYYLTSLENAYQDIGSGLIGMLKEPMEPIDFLNHLKDSMNLKVLRHTPITSSRIKKISICGGSGGFLLKKAMSVEADIFITSDMKYHEYFDAEGRIIIADIGHYESEVYTKELIYDTLTEKFSNFAVNLSETVTNPISYL
ncbi:Nif3-like dinuclear metal center hexameric protein [Fulvivirga sedimenti]|uniref:GTP cyclohydrolase 1 type 2 homolog n=1 Tax=Fulvivirga sedimenti TaxID=2879465 RepID=A0A9X1HNM2_9BACT|nr:Nif3-like dinuclear metal center hexameric protein [Fulvivirga sedimenti]MCA6073297.1 Nif3-like dinuclear metal center hexameric protein [Fulvivirga sedimenti]